MVLCMCVFTGYNLVVVGTDRMCAGASTSCAAYQGRLETHYALPVAWDSQGKGWLVGRSPTSAEGRGRVTSPYPGLFLLSQLIMTS